MRGGSVSPGVKGTGGRPSVETPGSAQPEYGFEQKVYGNPIKPRLRNKVRQGLRHTVGIYPDTLPLSNAFHRRSVTREG